MVLSRQTLRSNFADDLDHKLQGPLISVSQGTSRDCIFNNVWIQARRSANINLRKEESMVFCNIFDLFALHSIETAR